MSLSKIFDRWSRFLGLSARRTPVDAGISVHDQESTENLAAAETSSAMRLLDVATDDTQYQELLENMYAGDVRLDLKVAADAIRDTGLSHPQLLEVGCGSGYYNEVLRHLVGNDLQYTGLDYSKAMIDLARKKYPSHKFLIGDATGTDLPNGAYDIVFNGAALMHMPNYKAAIAESRRVARSWCIFHTVPLLQDRPTTLLTKKACGGDVIEVVLNKKSFENILHENELRVAHVYSSIAHEYLDDLVGERVNAFTYLCSR